MIGKLKQVGTQFVYENKNSPSNRSHLIAHVHCEVQTSKSMCIKIVLTALIKKIEKAD